MKCVTYILQLSVPAMRVMRASDMSHLGSTGKWCVAVCLELGLGVERDMGFLMNTWPCPKEVK